MSAKLTKAKDIRQSRENVASERKSGGKGEQREVQKEKGVRKRDEGERERREKER
jgi:hypothetical protein